MGHMQNKKQVLVQKQLTKADHKLSKTFYFTTYQLFQLDYESFSNLCEGFLGQKKDHFQLNTPVKILSILSTYYCIIYIYLCFSICWYLHS